MSTIPEEAGIVLGPEAAGVLMSLDEFDAIEEYDENYRYELVNGVLVVTPIAGAAETGPNDLLAYYLRHYQVTHPRGGILDDTLPQQYVRIGRSRRIADRLLWIGLGRPPNLKGDAATIAVEFVSAGRRNWQRDYIHKRKEYMKAGIKEYWIIDRFQRTLTVIRNRPGKAEEVIVPGDQVYRTQLLPGFELPLAQILEAADRWAKQR